MTKFYEDIEVGGGWTTETHEVTRDEMVGFARDYDPQPMHVDEEEARETFFGGLVASGWFTASVSMRLLVDGFLGDYAVVGATGVDALRWHEPVRPGDTLRVSIETVEKEPWNDRMGLVRYEQETTREDDDEVVMSLVADVLFERR
ncbi:MAG: MaoC/PaaZ C-terminal domain-containing protein [Halobacteriales archaeon]